MLETLGRVYAWDAEARERGLSRASGWRSHQEHSVSLMQRLRKMESGSVGNSGLGNAITYFELYWKALTLFPCVSLVRVREGAEESRAAPQECAVLSDMEPRW